jgi:hypothetical protein
MEGVSCCLGCGHCPQKQTAADEAAACAGLIVELPNRVNYENEAMIRKNIAKTVS